MAFVQRTLHFYSGATLRVAGGETGENVEGGAKDERLVYETTQEDWLYQEEHWLYREEV